MSGCFALFCFIQMFRWLGSMRSSLFAITLMYSHNQTAFENVDIFFCMLNKLLLCWWTLKVWKCISYQVTQFKEPFRSEMFFRNNHHGIPQLHNHKLCRVFKGEDETGQVHRLDLMKFLKTTLSKTFLYQCIPGIPVSLLNSDGPMDWNFQLNFHVALCIKAIGPFR